MPTSLPDVRELFDSSYRLASHCMDVDPAPPDLLICASERPAQTHNGNQMCCLKSFGRATRDEQGREGPCKRKKGERGRGKRGTKGWVW